MNRSNRPELQIINAITRHLADNSDAGEIQIVFGQSLSDRAQNLSDHVISGLSNEEIDAIPIQVARGPTKKCECSICRDNFCTNRFFKRLHCSHCYHPYCIGEWLARNKTCPMCRSDLSK